MAEKNKITVPELLACCALIAVGILVQVWGVRCWSTITCRIITSLLIISCSCDLFSRSISRLAKLLWIVALVFIAPISPIVYILLRALSLLPDRARRNIVIGLTYTSLIILGTAFTLPFLWLLSTSFKPSERIQRWPPDILPRLSVCITQNMRRGSDNNARVVVTDRQNDQRIRIRPLREGYRGPQWVSVDQLKITERTIPGLAAYNYKRGLRFINFGQQLRNTLVICVFAVIGSLLSCSLVAYGLSKIDWKGRNWLFIILLSTMMLPYQVIMVPVFAVFVKLRWVDTFLPLIVPAFLGNTFFIFLLRQFFMTIPRDLSEAARLDGCSEFDIYRRVILPLSKPALAMVGLWTFMGAWNDYLGPLIYLVDESKYTLSLGLAMFLGSYGNEFGMLMAVSTVVTLPIIILFFFTQRTFIQGITMTGIKA